MNGLWCASPRKENESTTSKKKAIRIEISLEPDLDRTRQYENSSILRLLGKHVASQMMGGDLHVFDARHRWMGSDTKSYKVRKPHSKSRTGCKSCKLRRVKCDERRPRCNQCERRGMICAYQGNSDPPLPIWPGRKTPPCLDNDPSAFTTEHDLEMLHHFVKIVGPDIYSKRAFDAASIDIWFLARSVPHVMHAVLAASALHLNSTAPSRAHFYVETGHWLDASSAFRSALTKNSYNSNPDPVLTTCMLLNLLSFANVDVSAPPESRWPLAPEISSIDPLQWLRVQLGLSPILTSLSMNTKGQSIWMPLFIASDHHLLHDERDGTTDIPAFYCRLFSLDERSQIGDHPYLRLVRRIVMLRVIHTKTEVDYHTRHPESKQKADHDPNALKYMQFMQGMLPRNVDLLAVKDARMVLLYMHFMAMLCSVRHWWCWPRATAETNACVRYLDRYHGKWLASVEPLEAGEGWLDFPGRQVGYVPQYGMPGEDSAGTDIESHMVVEE